MIPAGFTKREPSRSLHVKPLAWNSSHAPPMAPNDRQKAGEVA